MFCMHLSMLLLRPRLYVSTIYPVYIDEFLPVFGHWRNWGQRWFWGQMVKGQCHIIAEAMAEASSTRWAAIDFSFLVSTAGRTVCTSGCLSVCLSVRVIVCTSVCACVVVFVSTAPWTVLLSQTPYSSPRLKATELAHQSNRRTEACWLWWAIQTASCQLSECNFTAVLSMLYPSTDYFWSLMYCLLCI